MSWPARQRKPDEPKCLRPGCDSAQFARGLCATDKARAARLVKAGKTTWAALEKAGKALPSRRCMRAAAAEEWFLEGADPEETAPPLQLSPSVLDLAVTLGQKIDRDVRAGVPPAEICRALGATRPQILDSMRTVRGAGSVLWCRCGDVYDHRGPRKGEKRA